MVQVTVPARAGLAGNPSDGYGGAVLATPVPALSATVRITSAGASHGDIVVGPHDAGIDRLLTAAVARTHALAGASARTPGRLTASTTIPQSVGLAGSSALIIATIEAVARWWAVAVDVDTIASEALATEVDDLGIMAGLQDRICQTRRTTVFMDFGLADDFPAVREVSPPAPMRAFIAWAPAASAPSGVVHGGLRERFDAGDRAVVAAMRSLRTAAGRAAEALAVGDIDALGVEMDISLRIRESIIDLDPAMSALIDAARSLTPSVNSTGSGGAVVGLLPPTVSDEDVGAWARAAGYGAAVFALS